MLDSDIKTYHAAEVSSLSTNGGRRSNNLVISGVVNNVIPHVSRAVRQAGNLAAPLYRKLFTVAEDDNDGTLMATWQWLERVTDAGDWLVMFAGTPTNTQADITGSERKYGYAFLKNNIVAGSSTFTVTVKDASLASGTDAIFQAGDQIRPSTMATPTATIGAEEFVTIDTVDSVVGNDVTCTIDGTFANNYLVADGGFVVSILEKGDIACTVSGFTVDAAGTYAYDNVTYPLITDNIGTVYDHVTVTYTDATHFTAVGTSGINYGSGDTATDFAPVNAAKSKPYWTLEAAGHSGTAQAGDTIEFDVTAAEYAYWLRQSVPPLCPSLANNKVTAVTAGESAS